MSMSVNDYKSTTGIDLGVKNQLYLVGEFVQIESTDDEDQMYHVKTTKKKYEMVTLISEQNLEQRILLPYEQ